MPSHRTTVRATAAALVAAGALLTSACGSRTAAAPSPTLSVSAPASSPTAGARPSALDSAAAGEVQQRLDQAAGAVERLGASYPGSYTGLAVDVPGDRLVVYRTADPAFDAALARLHTGVRTDLRNAPRSHRQLEATRSRVERMMGGTTGYRILSVGAGSEASFSRGVVEVGVTGDLARAKRELGAAFGDGVSVSAEEPAVG